MIGLSVGLGVISAVVGYLFALLADVSIAGSMASTAGLIFGLIWVFSPNRGLISRWRRISKQRFEIDIGIMLTHISDKLEYYQPVTLPSISGDLGWTFDYSKKICKIMEEKKFIEKDHNENLFLTEIGRKKAETFTENK